MTDDDTPQGGPTGSGRSRSGTGSVDRAVTVEAAYDRVEGRRAFVVSALERDDAWLAVADGAELDLSEWR